MIGEHRFTPAGAGSPVSAELFRPPDARALFVFGHGAGAGMNHPFMRTMVGLLATRGIATFRYQFPYMERGSRRPDRHPLLLATVRGAIDIAASLAVDLPLLAGGKSMGGRMTSMALAEDAGGAGRPGGASAAVLGLVFFGFPLHPAGHPDAERAEHLDELQVPMMFLQGSRDALANLRLLRPVCERLGDRATLRVVAGADHGFHVLRRSGRTDEEVHTEMADAVAAWSCAIESDAGRVAS